jgi:hypothetical protein
VRKNLDTAIIGPVVEYPFHEEGHGLLKHPSLHGEDVVGLEQDPLLELFRDCLLYLNSIFLEILHDEMKVRISRSSFDSGVSISTTDIDNQRSRLLLPTKVTAPVGAPAGLLSHR